VKRISFNSRFINEAGNDLVPGKIHTIRQNYDFWKKFEGQDMALFTWEGKPYRSKQHVFCVKRIVSVQKITFVQNLRAGISWVVNNKNKKISPVLLAANDGFIGDNWDGLGKERAGHELFDWFRSYPDGDMAILHFTEFRY
jgi:hypothetical protein